MVFSIHPLECPGPILIFWYCRVGKIWRKYSETLANVINNVDILLIKASIDNTVHTKEYYNNITQLIDLFEHTNKNVAHQEISKYNFKILRAYFTTLK